jgi:hypothetical protein
MFDFLEIDDVLDLHEESLKRYGVPAHGTPTIEI